MTIKVHSYNCTYNPELTVKENGAFNTVKGTGIQIFTEYGEDENGNQTFKRVMDKNKNIIGEYKNLENIGFVGKKKYKRIINWMGEINKVAGCNIF